MSRTNDAEIQVRLSSELKDLLSRLARVTGRRQSAIVRELIRAAIVEHAETCQDPACVLCLARPR